MFPAYTIRANTRLVVVDVVVTDKKGQPITGLKAEDFTVEENGKKQKISVFVAPGRRIGRARTPAPAGILSNHPENVGTPAGRSDGFVARCREFPLQGPGLRALADAEVRRWSRAKLDIRMAVFTLTDRLRVLQQFTSDPQVLLTAIKNLKPQEQILRPRRRPEDPVLPADLGGPGWRQSG